MLKDIIKKIDEEMNKSFLSDDTLKALRWILPDLKKEAELQEEMVNFLVRYLKNMYSMFSNPSKYIEENIKLFYDQFGNIVRTLEKYYNKKWEEIIK
jgi:hypothetical protein